MEKRIFYQMGMLILLMLWSGCSSSDPMPEDEPVVIPSIVPDSSSETMFSQGISFSDEKSGEKSLSFTANANWTITLAESRNGTSWCTVYPTSGTSGKATVSIKVDENSGYDDRSVVMTVRCGTAQKTLKITQKQKDALLLTTKSFEVDKEGGSIQVEVKSNVDYEVLIPETSKEWIKRKSSSRGLETQMLEFTVEPNQEIEKREGEIIVKSGEMSETVKVYQLGGPVVLLSKNHLIVSEKGEEIEVEVKYNTEYTITSPSVDWLKEITGSRAMSSHTLKYEVLPNDTDHPRETYLVVSDKNSTLSDTLYIAQVQKGVLFLKQKVYEVDSKGGILTVDLNLDIDYQLDMPEEFDWIKQIDQDVSDAMDNRKLYFKVDKNDSWSSRTAQFVITDRNTSLTDTLTIDQQGYSTLFLLKQKEYTLPVNGSRFMVDIQYGKPYKILKMSQGLENPDIVLKEKNHDRLIFIANPSSGSVSKEIIISDEAESYKDTIRIVQKDTGEQLHGGGGNSTQTSAGIMYYKGATIYFDVHTNLDNYDILIFGNTETQKAKHLKSEKADFGFREVFEIPANTMSEDWILDFAFVGPNITYMTKIIVRRQLFIHIDEGSERYLSEKGDTITIHAWTEDDNLNIRLEGTDPSWLSAVKKEDTYVDGVRRINTTFVAEANKTGKTRELYVVAYNGFNDNERIKLIQPSGAGVLLSKERMIVGAWKNTQIVQLKDCEYSITPDASASWITIGQAEKKNGIIEQLLSIDANTGDNERTATLVIKSDTITHSLSIRQLPESGSLTDDSPEAWKAYKLPPVDVKNPYPYEMGSMLYFSIVEDPQAFIHIQSRKVLEQLYFTPEDEHLPKVDYLEYVLDNYDGISACYGGGNMKGIVLSNQYVESYYNAHGAKALVTENRGVLTHELTHAFQLEPKGCGDYTSSKVFHSCIEGMADAVRTLCGGFPNEDDRPKGGHYLDSYRYTGFFIVWLVKNKDKDFLRKFNLSTQHVNPWSFDGAIKYILGDKYNVDDLWTEYLKAMGDIK